MKELWLKFTDENGDYRRVLVETENFVIGRHSENDLCVPDSRLSRRHAEIVRQGDDFLIADCNSSNGTTLNYSRLFEPTELRDGDRINLGDGVEIEAEITSGEQRAQDLSPASDESGNFYESASAPEFSSPAVSAAAAVSAAPGSANAGGIPLSFFVIAPILGLLILGFAGGLLYVFSSAGGRQTSQNQRNSEYIYTDPKENRNREDEEDTPTPKPTASKTAANSSPTATPIDGKIAPTPQTFGDADKVERNAYAFMRRIAQNDPNPVLTGKNLETLNSKIKSFKGSAALRDNLQAARRASAQFEALAKAKNLKPQMLAVAGLAKLGNTRGDPLAAAQSMADVLQKLTVQVGNELADDNLIVIAAYEQGVSNQFLKMRDTMAKLTRQFPDTSSRTIRSIWFLRENGKLTDSEFELALRFLAIGTITQNPKDFNVETEAVSFN